MEQITNDYLEYYEADCKCVFTYSCTSIRKIDILRKLVTSKEKEIFCLVLKISEKKIVLSVGNLYYLGKNSGGVAKFVIKTELDRCSLY